MRKIINKNVFIRLINDGRIGDVDAGIFTDEESSYYHIWHGLPDAPEWIPYKPKDKRLQWKEWYLVSTKNGIKPFLAMWVNYWTGIYAEDGSKLGNVVAWQPLPAPYKEQS